MFRTSRPSATALAFTSLLLGTAVFMSIEPGRVEAQPRVYSAQCTFNGDCQEPLVCANGRCREACQTARDCHNGWVCERQVWVGGQFVRRAGAGERDTKGVCVGPTVAVPAAQAAASSAYAQPYYGPGQTAVPVPSAWTDGQARYGTNIGGRLDLETADPGRCEAACAKEAACRSWTYVKPGYQAPHAVCWIKSDNPAPIPEDCCVTGAK